MLTIPGIIAITALAGILTASPGEVNFDSSRPGSAPANWSLATASDGAPAWVVRADASAPSRRNVLEGSATGEDSTVAIFNPVVCRDGDVSVKFRIDPKAPGGTAGIVWRYKDHKNYYRLDFNAGRQTISLFRVQDGVRSPIPERRTGSGPVKRNHDIRPGEWHVAKISFRGNNIKVFFGNRRLFEATDIGHSQTGKVGVITTGTTVAAFDDFRIDKKG
ncbi:MAG: hypothetical protein JWN34_1767 [Bryobacterales bacterium]|jgi:hypothetical protein|nr:hypothetical protein [Bryobacterales bacterium]